jgi:hypothetical protein
MVAVAIVVIECLFADLGSRSCWFDLLKLQDRQYRYRPQLLIHDIFWHWK